MPMDGGHDAQYSEPDSGPLDGGHGPSPIVAPRAPTLTPCPPGWRLFEGAPSTCDPWPIGGRRQCETGSAHFPGEPDCARIGPACPPGGFPEDLPEGTVYVRLGASGSGTRDAPFGILRDALAAVPIGGTLALAPGVYAGPLIARRPMHLVGACMDTIIEGIVELRQGDSSASNMRIVSPEIGVRAARGRATFRSLDIRASDHGMDLHPGTVVDVSDVRIDSFLTNVWSAGTLTMQRAVLISNTSAFHTQGSARLEDISIETGDADASSDPVVLISVGALEMERFVIEGDSSPSVITIDGQLLLSDGVLRGPEESLRIPGPSVLGFEEAILTLDRVLIERPRTLALALDARSVLSARDVVIADVYQGTDVTAGTAIEISDGSGADIERLSIRGAVAFAVVVDSPTGRLGLIDARIESIASDFEGNFGRALQVQGGATLEGERISIDNTHEIALVCTGAGSMLNVTDLSVTRTLERSCVDEGCLGAGIGVGTYLGGSTRLTRFLIDESALAGVQIALDGSVDLHDGVISRAPVGANIQVDGYDLGRITDRIFYRDNGVNLESSLLEVPQPMLP